jgi:TetR/AcrR family transcriptional repressor of nem operon
VARPKEFDVDEALEQAMHLFWERGYEATAMSDLVAHLGVSRQSLYDTFGDKHEIYLAALRRRRETMGGPLRTLHSSDEPVRALLKKFFADVIDQNLAGECARGCLLVNAAVELSNADPEVRKIVCDNAQSVVDAFLKLLRRARERGEIGEHHDPVALARFFASVVAGLNVTAKTTRDRKTLEDVARTAIAVLG